MLRIAHRADARQRKLQLAVAGDFDNLPGKGVRAKIAGSDVLVGSSRLLKEVAIAFMEASSPELSPSLPRSRKTPD